MMMAVRLQEVHPSLVHFPIALLPTALAADALGRWTGSAALLEAGRRLMPAAAASAVVSALAGLAAQAAVKAEGEAHDLLVTHRNLNAGLTVLAVGLAATRLGRDKPGWGYLLAGLAGVATMAYTAAIGGRMVYAHGLGVEPADGVEESKAPEIRTDNLGEVAGVAADNIAHAARHALKHLKEGQIAPALRPGHGNA